MRSSLPSVSHRNLSFPGLYGHLKVRTDSTPPDRSLSRPSALDTRDDPESMVSDPSLKMTNEQRLDLWDESDRHLDTPLRTFLIVVIHAGFFQPILSWASGQQRGREIAAYYEAAQPRIPAEHKTSRAIDIYA